MDWLALVHILDEDVLWGKEMDKAPTWCIIGGRTWRHCYDRPEEQRRGQKTMKLLYARTQLYNACGWSCPATEMASALCEAIETVAKRYLRPDKNTFTWYLSADLGDNEEDVEFTIRRAERHSTDWLLDRNQITSALSLWLFYDQQTNQSSEHAEESLRLLGPSDIMDKLKEWPQRKLRYVKESSYLSGRDDANGRNTPSWTRKFRRNRIVGFNESLGLRLPSIDNGPARESMRGDSGSQQYQIEFQISQDTDELSFAPAIVARVSLAQLYSQHIFSGFMWALSKAMSDKVQRGDVDKIANDVVLNGLCDHEDALSSILPPLLYNNKLIEVPQTLARRILHSAPS
jgi:hypothetical protein